VLCFLRLFRYAETAKQGPGHTWHAAGAALCVLLLLAGPRWRCRPAIHVLGTDKVGQDVFYLALKSIRTSLVIGTLTTLVLLPVGIALGTDGGYFRGWVDDVIQYFYTTLNSIPGVLLIAASVLMMQVVIDRIRTGSRSPRSAPISGCWCCARSSA
jgi:peptide/nickel transport system permease protein